MPTDSPAFYDFQKREIANHATALLTACKWDVTVALTVIEALRPIAELRALNEKGEPVERTSGASPG